MKENRELTQPDEECSLAERLPLACNIQHDCNRSLVFLRNMANIEATFFTSILRFQTKKSP